MSKENADKEQKRSFKREVFSWIACIVVTILLTEFILNFVIINANIPSGSMENTIMTNDKLIALRTSYWFNDPKRGDIIIFKYPDDETEWFIKRVIALPGETVLVKDGKVYINGSKKALSEPYIKEEPVEDFGPYLFAVFINVNVFTFPDFLSSSNGMSHISQFLFAQNM